MSIKILISLTWSESSTDRGVSECITRSLLGEIQPLLHCPSHQLKQLMDEHNIEELPETEELWEVPEPKIIIPVKPGKLFFAFFLFMHSLNVAVCISNTVKYNICFHIYCSAKWV